MSELNTGRGLSCATDAQATQSAKKMIDQPEAFIFDLDGTLLDTLPDLVALTNATLEECGYPSRTRDEVLSFVGSGVKTLIRLALPEGTDEVQIEAAVQRWQKLYPSYGYKLTRPYEGIEEMLLQLRAAQIKLAVLSNKFDAATREVVGAFLPQVFDAVHGESPKYPRKPSPEGLLRTLEEMGVQADRCIFVGDSANDMGAARAAGVYSVGVSWGYNSAQLLKEEGACLLIDHPSELLHLLHAR